MDQSSVEGSALGGLVNRPVTIVAKALTSPPFPSAISASSGINSKVDEALDLTSAVPTKDNDKGKSVQSNGSFVQEKTVNADSTPLSLRTIAPTAVKDINNVSGVSPVDESHDSYPQLHGKQPTDLQKWKDTFVGGGSSIHPLNSVTSLDNKTKFPQCNTKINNIGADLTTIDTSSLSTIDSSQVVSANLQESHPSTSSSPLNNASRVVTAQGTIVPPLAMCHTGGAKTNNSGDVGASPPQSPSEVKSNGPTSTLSRPSSQLSQYTQLQSGSNGSKSVSPVECAASPPFNNSQRLKSPASVTGNRSNSNTPQKRRTPLSDCSPVPTHSPTPSPHSGCTSGSPKPITSSGAGCEVKGMPANPLIFNKSSISNVYDNGSASENDGGRLTFFKDGKPLLELSHRSCGGAGSGSESEMGGFWVQVKSSKTYWPPSAATQHSAAAAALPVVMRKKAGEKRNCSRKQTSPRHKSQRPGYVPHVYFIASANKAFRNGIPLRRNPFYRFHPYSIVPNCKVKCEVKNEVLCGKKKSKLDKVLSNRNSSLEKNISKLKERASLRTKEKQVKQIVDHSQNPGHSASNFVSPRKRYLRQMESEPDSPHQQRKKSMSSLNASYLPTTSQRNHVSQPQQHSKYSGISDASKASNNCYNNSAYSIDSLLSSSENRQQMESSHMKSVFKTEAGYVNNSSLKSKEAEPIKQEFNNDHHHHHSSRGQQTTYRGVGGAYNWHEDMREDHGRNTTRDAYRHHHVSSSASVPLIQQGAMMHPACSVPSTVSVSVVPTAAVSAPPPVSVAAHHPSLQQTVPATPDYSALPQQSAAAASLAALYNQIYDPNYLLRLTAAGDIIKNHHNQVAVAAVAAAAAAASINGIMASQYSNILNNALNPVALAAAASSPSLNPNLPAALTPALTPGAPPLPLIPSINPAAIPPPTLTPGMSPALQSSATTLPSLTQSHRSSSSPLQQHSARSSPYPSPSPRSSYPHSRSPYSPHSKPYTPAKSPLPSHANLVSPSPLSARSMDPSHSSRIPSSSSLRSMPPSPSIVREPHHSYYPSPHHHHPHSSLSPWRDAGGPRYLPSPLDRPTASDASSIQDMPLNLSKPRTK